MQSHTHRLRFLLRLVRECGESFTMMRIVNDARAAVYAETTGPYRPGVTETMIALDTALSAAEISLPLERVRAAYHAAVATCYATQGFISPTVATTMARVEYAAITRDTTAAAAFDALDEIDRITTAMFVEAAEEERSEQVEAGEAVQSEQGEAAEQEQSEQGEAAESVQSEQGEEVAEASEAVEEEKGDEERSDEEKGEAAEKEKGEEERSEEAPRHSDHYRAMEKLLKAERNAHAKAARERDEALLLSTHCDRCERTMEMILQFWASEGGMHKDEPIRPVEEETQRWSVYVEKMRALIEHMRATQ
jgi:hypothetical protein